MKREKYVLVDGNVLLVHAMYWVIGYGWKRSLCQIMSLCQIFPMEIWAVYEVYVQSIIKIMKVLSWACEKANGALEYSLWCVSRRHWCVNNFWIFFLMMKTSAKSLPTFWSPSFRWTWWMCFKPLTNAY